MLNRVHAMAAASALSVVAPIAANAQSLATHVFPMVVSAGVATCLPSATGRVTVTEVTGGQHLHVEVAGLPRNSNFNFFLTQVPKAPFGLSWYQTEVLTDFNGVGAADVNGIFSRETFIVAPGSAPNKQLFQGDASSNPPTQPIHTHHLGVWFDSPSDALKAGCPGLLTPFNGDHTAGVQVLNTANFPDLSGPLQQTK